MRICLDPGHGGTDRANRGVTGYVEADGVLDIALRLRRLLVGLGLEVVMTREGDRSVSLRERTDFAKAKRADYFISIHTDAFSNPVARGFTVFSSAYNEQSKALANRIEEAMREAGRPSRGVRTRTLNDGRDYYHVIREAGMPSVLVEAGFHTNPEEEALLKTAEFRQLIAEAIALGVRRHLEQELEGLLPIFLDGQALSVPGRLIEGVTYVPVRALAEALGFGVQWDSRTRTVRITSDR